MRGVRTDGLQSDHEHSRTLQNSAAGLLSASKGYCSVKEEVCPEVPPHGRISALGSRGDHRGHRKSRRSVRLPPLLAASSRSPTRQTRLRSRRAPSGAISLKVNSKRCGSAGGRFASKSTQPNDS